MSQSLIFFSKQLVAGLSVAMLLTACGPDQPKTGEINAQDVTNSQSATGNQTVNIPVIKFEEETHDYGRITQGEKVAYAFKFKNVGKSNLIITSAQGSCGCTVPEWPRKPIMPGEEGKIDVVFSSEGKQGMVEKTVTLITNGEPSTKVLTIKADIIVPTSANPNALSN